VLKGKCIVSSIRVQRLPRSEGRRVWLVLKGNKVLLVLKGNNVLLVLKGNNVLLVLNGNAGVDVVVSVSQGVSVSRMGQSGHR
jgi:hypothetical protein